ncbi:MAG: hypothetical protein C4305_09450, partial [Thermoleophilia bacterium]
LAPLHGHRDSIPPEERCAFLALPFVGHGQATGEIIGVGIALGKGVERALRRALLQLVGLDRDEERPRLDRLHVPELGLTLPLVSPDGRWTLEAERWCRPARRWASSLPV